MDKPSDRLFLDTGYVLARFNRRDQYHGKARQLAEAVAAVRELWTTDAVLFETAAALSHPKTRPIFTTIWDEFHGGDPRCRVFETGGTQLDRAVELFRQRADKSWSLTDCFSFVAMQDEQLVDALSADHHFVQAGFRALLMEA